MCGFPCIWRASGLRPDNCEALEAMTVRAAHRAPDSGGIWPDRIDPTQLLDAEAVAPGHVAARWSIRQRGPQRWTILILECWREGREIPAQAIMAT